MYMKYKWDINIKIYYKDGFASREALTLINNQETLNFLK